MRAIDRLFISVAFSLIAGPVLADVEIDIPSQPVGDALNQFAEQSGLQVVMYAGDAEGVETDAVQGTYEEPTEVLDTLLASTGLEYNFINDRTVSVSATVEDERGASDSKNLTPQPVLMAQNQTSPTPTTSQSQNKEGGTGIVTGKVTDARTGANLKGAKVTIEETGQWTSTNGLGEFRFVNVPTGSATLTVSYLGYAGQSAVVGIRGGGASQNFALRGGSEMEEIVVWGQRSARALALNQERTASNFSTVVSADLLGQFNGTTIAEALRRAPGIAFVPNEETGEGSGIIVRGLGPDLNQVTLNGLRIPEGSGRGRSPDLSTLLTESVDTVVINKTLLPSQDSTGTGGLIEITTRSPLDRARRFASISAEYGWRGENFGQDTLFSGTASGTFLNDESFGASVSVQHRNREVGRASYNASYAGLGTYLPDGDTSPLTMDPRRPFPFDDGVTDRVINLVQSVEGFDEVDTTAILISLAKRISDHTSLTLDYTHNESESDNSAQNTFFSAPGAYAQLLVPEVGEPRYAWVSEGAIVPGQVFFFPGRGADYIAGAETITTTISARGETDVGPWSIGYAGGYTKAENNTPVSYGIGLSNPQGFFLDRGFLRDDILAQTIDGRLVSPFPIVGPSDRSFIFPGFNESGEDFFSDGANVPLANAQVLRGTRGENERWTTSASVRRELSEVEWLDYLEVGLHFERAEFGSVPSSTSASTYVPLNPVSLSDLGFTLGQSRLSRLGVTGAPPSIGLGGFAGFEDTLSSLLESGELLEFPSEVDPSSLLLENTEEELAFYVQAQANLGKAEVIGGLRVAQVDVSTDFFSSVTLFDQNGLFDPVRSAELAQRVPGAASQTEILPRILINYRVDDNMIVRAGYFSTYARPRVQNLVNASSFTLNLFPNSGPNFDQPSLNVVQGNPNLEPAFTENFDLSWEWYTSNIGVIKVSAFYKTTENFLQLNQRLGSTDVIPDELTLPDEPEFNNLPDNTFVTVFQPRNGDGSADLWGAEFNVERQFDFLPGFWSGFGIYANYTYTDSSRSQVLNYFNPAIGQSEEITFPDEPYDGSPRHSGTVAITYTSDAIESRLTYSAQDRRRSGFLPHGLHPYNEAVDTLDFFAQWVLPVGPNIVLSFEGLDLLTDADEPFLGTTLGGEDGVPKYFTGGNYFGGRSFRVRLAASF